MKITYVGASLYVTNYKDGMQNTNAHDTGYERGPLKLGSIIFGFMIIHLKNQNDDIIPLFLSNCVIF
jgi:hypothetical protein